jgi:regulator of chromosome condensation
MISKKRSNSSTDITVLKNKRSKVGRFNSSIPTRPKEIGQVYVIGSNEFYQCGMDGLECSKGLKLIKDLEKFKIVDISAGPLHNAALTSDGKIVTWGVNDHGKFISNLIP